MSTRTPPTTPRIHPTIRRSYEGRACPCEGRGTSPLLPPNPPPSPSPQAKAAGRLRVRPLLKRRCRLALPCFPLSISRHFPPGPTAPVRPAPWQIRLVPLFRPFQLPPAGPSAPHPARACQIRLVPLCRLVRRASNPSWTAFPQAWRREKHAQHNSTQLNPRRNPTSPS